MTCRKVFVSIQMALSSKDAARWADVFEMTQEQNGLTDGPSVMADRLAEPDEKLVY
jgi:hypothetical protein